MARFNGLVGIDSYLAPIVASTSLSSERAVLIHQFEPDALNKNTFGKKCIRAGPPTQ